MREDAVRMSDIVSVPPATAHAKIRALYDYWLGQAPAPGKLPGRQHLDPIHIPKLLENVWLVDVIGNPARFRFRLIGGAAHRIGSRAIAGDYVDKSLAEDSEPMRQLRLVVSSREPVWFRGPVFMPHDAQMFSLERIFLPLAADGRTVDMLLCLTVYYSTDGRDI